MGPNSVLTNGHIPDHRCYATSIYLYDLCQVRVVKLKAANKQIIVRSFFKYRSLQVRSGPRGASDISDPTVPGCSRAEHSLRAAP